MKGKFEKTINLKVTVMGSQVGYQVFENINQKSFTFENFLLYSLRKPDFKNYGNLKILK